MWPASLLAIDSHQLHSCLGGKQKVNAQFNTSHVKTDIRKLHQGHINKFSPNYVHGLKRLTPEVVSAASVIFSWEVITFAERHG